MSMAAKTCEECDGSGMTLPMLPADDPANEMCPECKGMGAHRGRGWFSPTVRASVRRFFAPLAKAWRPRP